MKLVFAIVVSFSILLISFSVNKKTVRLISGSKEQRVDVLPGSSPYLTKDVYGRTVLSWVRTLSDSTSVLCYSILDRENKTVIIKSSNNISPHAENLPKVIFKPSGEIVAVWGAKNPNPNNKYSGLIFYSQSFDDGKTWTPATRLVSDPNGYDQRYSDVALMKSGEVAIIWLDNRKTKNVEGSAVYCAVTNGKNGFSNETLVSQPACQCCRTSIFVDNNDNIHALYRGIINDSIRDMVHIVSSNAGKSFTAPERIFKDDWVLRGCPHTGPSMTENSKGLHYTWYTGGLNKGSFYIRSTSDGSTFSGHDSINSKGMHPQITSTAGDKLVVAWDETIQVGSEYYKRIGLQVRSGDGKKELNSYITTDEAYSTYPVVSAVDNNNLVVAYTAKLYGRDYVKWQRVSLHM